MGLIFSSIQRANLSSFNVPSARASMTATHVGVICRQAESVQIEESFRDYQSCPLIAVNERMVFDDPIAIGGGQPGEVTLPRWLISRDVFGPVEGGDQQALIADTA